MLETSCVPSIPLGFRTQPASAVDELHFAIMKKGKDESIAGLSLKDGVA